MEYRKLLFSELHLAVIDAETDSLNDKLLIKAMTVNENLKSLGISLRANDVIRLAKSKSLDTFYDSIKEFIGKVKAKPMYPDFPNQVMNLTEAQFRMHQLVHYFSTYGAELFFGAEVSQGWLPSVKDTEKVEDDELLISSKVIEIIDQSQQYLLPAKKILEKRERMTDKEKAIVAEAIKKIPLDQLVKINVPFKQNLLTLFYLIFSDGAIPDREKLLFEICKHSGDVLKCADYVLTREKYHFSTSRKKLLVKLFEKYSIKDFRENIILSNKKAERAILLFQYLDYNNFSRSIDHKKAVAELRNGKLTSWEGKAKKLIENKSPDTLDYIGQRPGMLLRMVAFLVRKGFDSEEIEKRLNNSADTLSIQTIVSILNFYGQDKFVTKCTSFQSEEVYRIIYNILLKKFTGCNTLLKNKKVYFDLGDYDLDKSIVVANKKSSEGGYIHSGLAYKIPKEIKRLRFFVYWNDKDRVDVDLHASGVLDDDTPLTIGWDANYKEQGVIFSGDITHSNAAEYIDVDLNSPIKYINTNINLYYGKDSFGQIEECFVGMMAVGSVNEEVKLYNPANCFFNHYLKGNYKTLNYGYIDLKKRCLVFNGRELDRKYYDDSQIMKTRFNLSEYLNTLLRCQCAIQVSDKNHADLILVMGKPSHNNQVSLIDENFFM